MPDLLLAYLVALVVQAFLHLPEEAGAVDELDLALAVGMLGVVEDPDVGGDAGVEEHVGRQRDDGLDEVVLQQPLADVGWPGAGASVEQGRAVHDDPDPAAAVLGCPHLVGQVQQEEHLPVRGGRQTRSKPAVGTRFVAFP